MYVILKTDAMFRPQSTMKQIFYIEFIKKTPKEIQKIQETPPKSNNHTKPQQEVFVDSPKESQKNIGRISNLRLLMMTSFCPKNKQGATKITYNVTAVLLKIKITKDRDVRNYCVFQKENIYPKQNDKIADARSQ